MNFIFYLTLILCMAQKLFKLFYFYRAPEFKIYITGYMIYANTDLPP